jgi:hypothetical protein
VSARGEGDWDILQRNGHRVTALTACWAVIPSRWHSAGEEQFVAEEAEGLTDESDDPDAKEIDYDDEYAESDEGEDSRDGYGIHGDDGLEAEYRGYSY